MTKRKTIWLILAIGVIAIIGAIMLLGGGAEENAHDGARFISAGARL